MKRFWVCSSALSFGVLLAMASLHAQAPPSISNSYVPVDVPNSIVGFQSQVDELVRVGKTHDQSTWNVALGTFALPNAATWFEGNFSSQHVAQLSQDYPKVRDGHLGHISWVLGHNVDATGFAIKVEPSEMPAPPSDAASNPFSPVPSFPSLSRIFA